MTPRLPACRPKDACRALERAGFRLIRQRGSHRIYTKGDRGVTVPYHTKDLKRGTLKAIIEDAGLTEDAFLELL